MTTTKRVSLRAECAVLAPVDGRIDCLSERRAEAAALAAGGAPFPMLPGAVVQRMSHDVELGPIGLGEPSAHDFLRSQRAVRRRSRSMMRPIRSTTTAYSSGAIRPS